MVYPTVRARPALGSFGQSVTKQDYDREAEEFARLRQQAKLKKKAQDYELMQAERDFALRKQQAAQEQEAFQKDLQMQEREMDLKSRYYDTLEDQAQTQRMKALADINQEKRPFEGTSFKAQMGNELYREYRRQGFDDTKARQLAYDKILTSDTSTYTDPATGQRVVRSGSPVFGVQQQWSQPTVPAAPASQFAAAPSQGGVAPMPDVSPASGEQGSQSKMPRLWDLADATGTVPALIEKYDQIGGQLGLPTNDELVDKRQMLRSNVNAMVRALMPESSRYPVRLVELIREDVNLLPGLIDSPEALRSRIRGVDRVLAEDENLHRSVLSDPMAHVDDKRDAREMLRAIQDFRGRLGVPTEEEEEERIAQGEEPLSTREQFPRTFGFTGQVNRAIAEGAGFPLEVGHMVNRVLGISEDVPLDGAETVAEGMRKLGIYVPGEDEPIDTWQERAGRLTGDTATAAIYMLAPALRVAQGKGLLSGATKRVLDSIARNPGAFTLGELASITGATAGGQLMQRASGGDKMSEVAGEVAGGVAAPLMSPLYWGSQGYGAAKRAMKGGMNKNRRASKRLAATVEDPETAVQSLDAETISDLTPAQRLDMDEAYRLEKQVASTDPAYGKQLARRNAANRQVLRSAADVAGDPAYFRDYVEGRVQQTRADTQQQADTTSRRAAERMDEIRPTQRPEEASMRIRGELDEAYDAAKAQEDALWSQVPKEAKMPTESIKARFNRIIRDLPPAQRRDVPEVLTQEMRRMRVGPKKGPDASQLKSVKRASAPGRQEVDALAEVERMNKTESVRNLQGLRSALLEEARRAESEGRRNTARIANQMAEAVLEDLGAAAGSAQGDVGETLRNAMDFSRQFNERFRQGTVGRVLSSDRTGGDRVRESLTLQSTVASGKAPGAVAIDDILDAAGTPEARGAIGDYVRSQAEKLVDRDGVLSVTRAENWVRNNEEILNRVPEVRDRMAGAIRAQRRAERAAKRAKQFDTSLNNQQKSVASSLLGKQVGSEVEAIMKARRPAEAAKAVKRLIRRDPEAQAGLRKATTDYFFNKAGTKEVDEFGNTKIDGQALRAMLDDTNNRAVLREVAGDEYASRMDRIADELARIDKAEAAGRGAEVMDDTPSKLLSIFGRGGAAAAGGKMGGGTTGGSLRMANIASSEMEKLLRKLSGDKAEALVRFAVDDPELYKTLLMRIETPEQAQKAFRRLNLWLSSTGQQAFEDDEE